MKHKKECRNTQESTAEIEDELQTLVELRKSFNGIKAFQKQAEWNEQHREELNETLKSQLYQILNDTISLNTDIIKVKTKPNVKPLKSLSHKDYNKFMEWFHNGTKKDDFKKAANRQQHWKGKRIKDDTLVFKEWLKHFGSMKDLTHFLHKVSEQPNNSTDFKLFFKEVQDWLLVYKKDYKPTYSRYLSWLNQTVYDKRLLVNIMFHTFFNNECKKVTRTIEYKGITAKHMKSKKRKILDEGTNKEYNHKVVIKDTFINQQAKIKAKYLGKHKSVNKQMYAKGYGIFKTFAFKFLFRRNEQDKRFMKRKTTNQQKKILKYNEKSGQDIYQLKDYILENSPEKINITLYNGEDTTKNISKIKRILRNKYYKNLTTAITNKDTVVDVGHKSKLAELGTVVQQFVEDFKRLK